VWFLIGVHACLYLWIILSYVYLRMYIHISAVWTALKFGVLGTANLHL